MCVCVCVCVCVWGGGGGGNVAPGPRRRTFLSSSCAVLSLQDVLSHLATQLPLNSCKGSSPPTGHIQTGGSGPTAHVKWTDGNSEETHTGR